MTQRRGVLLVLVLNVSMVAGLMVAGLFAHSVSLVAEGGDFLADSLALASGLLAIYLRDRHRNEMATTWVALLNALWLPVLSVGVAVSAARRLISGSPEVHGLPVLAASAIALVMLCAALILGADAGREDLHMRSILLDTIADGCCRGCRRGQPGGSWLSPGPGSRDRDGLLKLTEIAGSTSPKRGGGPRRIEAASSRTPLSAARSRDLWHDAVRRRPGCITRATG